MHWLHIWLPWTSKALHCTSWNEQSSRGIHHHTAEQSETRQTVLTAEYILAHVLWQSLGGQWTCIPEIYTPHPPCSVGLHWALLFVASLSSLHFDPFCILILYPRCILILVASWSAFIFILVASWNLIASCPRCILICLASLASLHLQPRCIFSLVASLSMLHFHPCCIFILVESLMCYLTILEKGTLWLWTNKRWKPSHLSSWCFHNLLQRLSIIWKDIYPKNSQKHQYHSFPNYSRFIPIKWERRW